MSVCIRNLRNFHCTTLRKSLHFSQTCLQRDTDCTRWSERWGRESPGKEKKDKNPEQQLRSEKAVRILKHIQTAALEIKLKNLVTSGSLRRLLLFPSCKALGTSLAAHGGLWKSWKDDAVVPKQRLAESFPLNTTLRLLQRSVGQHETQIILHQSLICFEGPTPGS